MPSTSSAEVATDYNSVSTTIIIHHQSALVTCRQPNQMRYTGIGPCRRTPEANMISTIYTRLFFLILAL